MTFARSLLAAAFSLFARRTERRGRHRLPLGHFAMAADPHPYSPKDAA